jgi:hypothetical protein
MGVTRKLFVLTGVAALLGLGAVSMAFAIRSRFAFVALTVVGALGFAFPAGASADQVITSAGPLTDVGITSDLNCSVDHAADTDPAFFGTTACGTLVASGGTLYGPASIPAGSSAGPRTAFTPVSRRPSPARARPRTPTGS